MDLQGLMISVEFCRANAIAGEHYNVFRINQMLAGAFGPSYSLNWRDQWLGVLKFMRKPIHTVICDNPPAPLNRIPVEAVKAPWPTIESGHDRTLVNILTDYAIYRYWVQQDINGPQGARAWKGYFAEENRTVGDVCDAGRRGKRWSRIADTVGAGLLYAIACSRVVTGWAGTSSESLSDHELDLVLAWIATREELQTYCLGLTLQMSQMLRGQEPGEAPFEQQR
ncbi:hypothetical protein BDZ91DRAFT_807103 [Kalaharituber pfeilii]|nr:hypothetical protein BDZ91DRAFT_807103 [Kalaharituber pfeilii]